MEIAFKNIDKDYVKGKKEFVGDIQPKFWYKRINSDGEGDILVKRQHSQIVQKNKPKSKLFNHIGEYFGYVIAEKAGLKVCPVELVTLHDTKNRYSTTIRLFTACASKNIKKPGNTLISGESIIESFYKGNNGVYKKLLSQPNSLEDLSLTAPQYQEDNIDIAISAMVYETANFEQRLGKRTKIEIANDIRENVKDFIDMAVYDCLFGNNDRHSGNWSMEIDPNSGRAQMYPMYDNEAVLGLRLPKTEIEEMATLSRKELEKEVDKKLYSRMGYIRKRTKAPYKEVLDYLVEKYPEYAIPSIKNITEKVTPDFIRSLYYGVDNLHSRGEDKEELTRSDDLPHAYSFIGQQLMINRRNYALDLIKKKTDLNKQIPTYKKSERYNLEEH